MVIAHWWAEWTAKFSLYPHMLLVDSLPLIALIIFLVSMTNPPILCLQLWSPFSCSEPCTSHFDSWFFTKLKSQSLLDLLLLLLCGSQALSYCHSCQNQKFYWVFTSPSPSFSTAHHTCTCIHTHTCSYTHMHTHSFILQSSFYLSNVSGNQLLCSNPTATMAVQIISSLAW